MTPQDKIGQNQQVDLDQWEEMVRQKYQVPQGLWKAMAAQESGGDVNAVSPTGVRGRYQVTKATAAQYGLDRDDPYQQAVAAAKHLRAQYDSLKDIADDNARWLGAVGRYYGGGNAVDRSGNLSSKSPDGVSTPDVHVERVARKWGELNRGGAPVQPVVQQRATPQAPQPAQPRTLPRPQSKPYTPKIPQSSPFAPQGALGIVGEAEKIAGQISPTTKQQQYKGEQELKRYKSRSPLGKAAEVATSGFMRGAEGLIKAGRSVGAMAHPLGGFPTGRQGMLTPEAQAALEQQSAVRAQVNPLGAPVGEGVASAITQAPAYIVAGQAGIPGLAAINAAQEDWADPAGAAKRTALNTAIPVGAGRLAGRAAQPAINRLTSPTAQAAGRLGVEVVGGAAGNVAQTAATQTTDPRELARQALIGGIASGVTARPGFGKTQMAPQSASDLAMRPRPTRAPITDIDTSRRTVAEYVAKVDQINQAIPAGPERIAALQQARAEYQAARRGVLPEDVQRFIPQSKPVQEQAQPGTAPLTAPLTEELTPNAPETQVLPQTPTDPRRNLVDQTRAKADAALSEGRYADAISELKAHQEALKQLKRAVGKDAPGERVRIEREIGRAGNQIGEVRKQAREAARAPKPPTLDAAPTRPITAELRNTPENVPENPVPFVKRATVPLQEPTNRIKTGEGDEMPREVGRQLEGQPIEIPTRYTEYAGGELQRYSKPLEGQPIEIPAKRPRPQTAELTEPDYMRDAPPPIPETESFRSPEDARRGKFELMQDTELDSAIKQLENTRNAAIQGKTKLDPNEQQARELELKTAKAVRSDRLAIQRSQGREPGERLTAYASKFRFQDETLHRMARDFYNKHGYYPKDPNEVRAGRPLKPEAPETMEAVRRSPLPDPEKLTDERLEKLIRDGERIRENATDPPADAMEWLEKAKHEREKRQQPKEPEVQQYDQWSKLERARERQRDDYRARYTTGEDSISGRSKDYRERFSLAQETSKPTPDFANAIRQAYPQSNHGQARYNTVKRFKIGDDHFFAGLNRRTNIWEVHSGNNDLGPRLFAINPIDVEGAPVSQVSSEAYAPQSAPEPSPAVSDAKPARTIQHSDFGEVTIAENQKGVGRGKLRVVDADGNEHIIQRPTTGRGNRKAAMAKAATVETPAPLQSVPDAIRAAKPNGGLVRIQALRDAGITDAAILEAAERGEISLSRGEKLTNKPDELLDDGQGNVYIGASVRDGGETAKAKRQSDWRTADQRTPALDAKAQAEYAKAERIIQAARAEQAKLKPTSSGFTASDQKAYAKQQAKIEAAEALRVQARNYAKKPKAPSVTPQPETKAAEVVKPAPLPKPARARRQPAVKQETEPEAPRPKVIEPSEAKQAEIAAKAQKEKINPRTGFTPSQETYVVETARENLPALRDDKPITVKVPGDGQFTLYNDTQANNFVYRLTGKPIEKGMPAQITRDTIRASSSNRGLIPPTEKPPTGRAPVSRGQYPVDVEGVVPIQDYKGRDVALDLATNPNTKESGLISMALPDGRQVYTNKRVLVVGDVPKGESVITDPSLSPEKVATAFDLPKKSSEIKPVAFYSFEDGKSAYIAFSDGSTVDADYYNHIVTRYPEGEWMTAPPEAVKSGLAPKVLMVDGKPVAAIMPLQMKKALPADVQALMPQTKPKFVADAEARLKDAASGKLAGSGGQALADQAIVTGYKVYKAGMRFGEWARAVIKEAGDSVKPYLRETWKKISGSFSTGKLPDEKPGQTLGAGLGALQGMFGKRGKSQTPAPAPSVSGTLPVDLPYLRRDNGDAYKKAVSDAIRARTDDAAEIKRIEAMADRAVRAHAANSPLGGQIDAQIRQTFGGSAARTASTRSQNVRSTGQPVQPRPAPRGQATQAATQTTTARTARTGATAPTPTGQSRADKIASNIGSTLSLPRALMASLDVSAPLRQGAILTLPPTQWKRAANAGLRMFQAFSTKQYNRISQEINSHPDAQTAKDAGLYLATDPNAPKSLQGREEDFITKWAGKIPGVKHSEQAYKTYLDSLRIDTFAKYKKAIEKQGGSPEQQDAAIKAAAKWINVATGRGSLGETFDKATPLLSTVFFAPKYVASRVNALNPVMYAKMPSSVRKQAIGDLVQFAGVVGATLALAKAAGAEVSTDPDDADFLKIKVGTTRYDGLAGLQQVMRLFYRVGKDAALAAKGESPVRGQSAFDITGRFLRSKLAPVPSYFVDALTRKDFIGRDFDAKRGAIERVTPLIWRDYYEAYQREGLGGAAKMTPGMFGIGVADYQKRTGNFELKGEKFASEARKHGIVYESAQRLKDEPEDLFKTRSGKIRDWLDQHGEALISHPRYSGLSDEQKRAAIEALRQRIGQQANQQRPNPSAFTPTRIIAGVLRAERERPRREAGKIYVER